MSVEVMGTDPKALQKAAEIPVIKKELDNLDLPKVVEERARDILLKIRKYPKVTQRKGEIFFAVYNAYRELGLVCPDESLAAQLDVGKRAGAGYQARAKALLKMFYRMGYPAPLVMYEPTDYVLLCCEEASIPIHEHQRVIALINKTLLELPQKNLLPPGTIAAGVVSYYAQTVIGRYVDEVKLSALVGGPKQLSILRTVSTAAMTADLQG